MTIWELYSVFRDCLAENMMALGIEAFDVFPVIYCKISIDKLTNLSNRQSSTQHIQYIVTP